MTNEEAVVILKIAIKKPNTEDGYLGQALTMAIEALEQRPCEDMRDATEEERKSTKDYIDSISKPTGLQFDDIYEELDFVQPHKKTSVNLQPCEDCISRDAAKKSIQRKIDEVVNEDGSYDYDMKQYIKGLITAKIAINRCNLPSVQPQPKRGKWIEIEICNCHATLKCSVCDRIIEPNFTYGEYSYEDIKEWYPFCHCGADMRESEEEK